MDETNIELKELFAEGDDLAAVLSNLRSDETLSDWERQTLIIAAKVEFANNPERYKLIPRQDSCEGYGDM